MILKIENGRNIRDSGKSSKAGSKTIYNASVFENYVGTPIRENQTIDLHINVFLEITTKFQNTWKATRKGNHS